MKAEYFVYYSGNKILFRGRGFLHFFVNYFENFNKTTQTNLIILSTYKNIRWRYLYNHCI